MRQSTNYIKVKQILDFNPLTQWRVRLDYLIQFRVYRYFNPLTQWRVRHRPESTSCPFIGISIHSLNEEWDKHKAWVVKRLGDNFNPLTQWRVRHNNISPTFALLVISIHSLNEEWDNAGFQNFLDGIRISIHSLNEEWDWHTQKELCAAVDFNPLTQWRVRPAKHIKYLSMRQFQSTHSMKSETLTMFALHEAASYFNPLTQWRVRHFRINLYGFRTSISIHSLNEEWDDMRATLNSAYCDFNPLTQWRVRPISDNMYSGVSSFQSTHSMKSETIKWRY